MSSLGVYLSVCLRNRVGKTVCFGLPDMGVCVFLSGCVCWDNGIIEVLWSQAPRCLARRTGVSRGTLGWIR